MLEILSLRSITNYREDLDEEEPTDSIGQHQVVLLSFYLSGNLDGSKINMGSWSPVGLQAGPSQVGAVYLGL